MQGYKRDAVISAFRKRLSENVLLAAWAMMKLHDNQTGDEQVSHVTKHQNGVGFNMMDAEIGSSLAMRAAAWQSVPPEKREYGSPYSEKQADIACRLAVKYAGQLIEYLSDDMIASMVGRREAA